MLPGDSSVPDDLEAVGLIPLAGSYNEAEYSSVKVRPTRFCVRYLLFLPPVPGPPPTMNRTFGSVEYQPRKAHIVQSIILLLYAFGGRGGGTSP